MLEKERIPEFFNYWHIVRNHLIKKYPQLRHYDLEYVKGHESRIINRILLLTGMSERRLEKEIEESFQKQSQTRPSAQYF
jgi:hypothetical protein